MMTRLRESLERAERVLPSEAIEALATAVDLLALSHEGDPWADFTPAERAEIEALAAASFTPADEDRVRALWARHGLPNIVNTMFQRWASPLVQPNLPC